MAFIIAGSMADRSKMSFTSTVRRTPKAAHSARKIQKIMILSAACQFLCPLFFNVFGSIVSSEVQTHLAVVLLVVDYVFKATGFGRHHMCTYNVAYNI